LLWTVTVASSKLHEGAADTMQAEERSREETSDPRNLILNGRVKDVELVQATLKHDTA